MILRAEIQLDVLVEIFGDVEVLHNAAKLFVLHHIAHRDDGCAHKSLCLVQGRGS